MATLKDSIITGDLRVTGTIYGLISGNAATAAKLQTPRTINGTNFDGSANITTANWGTSRTITIGSTGKSVNGSGNVAWTLAEIGAAASTHTHATSLASGGTATITLAANTAYTLTAGGTSVVFKTPADNNTTYTPASSVTAVSTTSAVGTSTAYARQDHVHNITLATGDSNGQVKIAGSNVSVKGLGTAAYTASTAYSASTHNHDSTYLKLSGGTLTGALTMSSGKPINQILTGSGTAGSDAGSGASPRYFPAKWTFNTGANATNGDIFTIKIPVAGHNYGVYMSVNNGTNYYPIVLSGTGRVTTHYPVNTYIQVVFESTGSATSMTPVAGADSANGSTISGGVFRVINYYDSGNNYNWVRPYYCRWKTKTALYRYMLLFTMNETYLLPANATNNSTATTKTLTTESFDPFGDIYFYDNTNTVNADAVIPDNRLESMTGLVDLRYSFNTGTTLTANKQVYMVLALQTNGLVKLHTAPITQTLPTTDDGLLYKLIGVAYDTYRIQLIQTKPVYIYKNNGLQPYAGYAASTNASGHSHTLTLASGGTATVTLAANTAYTLTAGGSSIIFKTPADNNTTYTAASSVTAVSTTSAVGTSTAYARQDHTHNIALATGDSNGQVKIAGSNVSVKGLGTAAYTASTAYSSSTHTHGNIGNTGLMTASVTLASGDRLVVTDSSASHKIATSTISFDGSTTTKALTPKGTWETFTQGTINNAALTLNYNGTNLGSFTANASTATTISWTGPSVYVQTTTPSSPRTGDIWVKTV